MVAIRIPREHWGDVWRALVAAGPISRVSEEPVYLVSDHQLRMLRRKKLPFELVGSPNGRAADEQHG
ncbi:MAG TPA: hypothetical protein VFG68_18025 [Fimbriiglobus sp.]|nr:hypothetical protein [Fimbriiglobus sp.]